MNNGLNGRHGIANARFMGFMGFKATLRLPLGWMKNRGCIMIWYSPCFFVFTCLLMDNVTEEEVRAIFGIRNIIT